MVLGITQMSKLTKSYFLNTISWVYVTLTVLKLLKYVSGLERQCNRFGIRYAWGGPGAIPTWSPNTTGSGRYKSRKEWGFFQMPPANENTLTDLCFPRHSVRVSVLDIFTDTSQWNGFYYRAGLYVHLVRALLSNSRTEESWDLRRLMGALSSYWQRWHQHRSRCTEQAVFLRWT